MLTKLLKPSILGIACLSMIAAGCTTPTPTVPNPLSANFTSGDYLYNCAFTTESAATGVFFGHGKLMIQVTGTTTPQFSQTTTYSQSTITSPTVVTQNGTASTGQHKIVANCVYLDVPDNGGYKVMMRYTEGSTATCFPPGGNQCYRWIKQIDVPAGTIPTCAGSSYVYIVDQMDPDGFVGPCN